MEVLLQVLFYLTPIIYPAQMLRDCGTWAGSSTVNPLAWFLDLIRQPLTRGAAPPPDSTRLHAIVAAGRQRRCIARRPHGLLPRTTRHGLAICRDFRSDASDLRSRYALMTLISLENVGLVFHVRRHGRISLKEYLLHGLFRRRKENNFEVRALEGINLQIERRRAGGHHRPQRGRQEHAA